MADKIPYFEKDMEIIGKLGDTPGTDDNLDWRELQAKFDEGGKATKEYLNTVAGILNSLFSASGGTIIGGNMTGNLNLNLYRLFGIRTPVEKDDAVNKEYADTMLPKAGGTMTGSISMSGQIIRGLGEPLMDSEAATKGYVDGLGKTLLDLPLVLRNHTVEASSWTEDTDKTYEEYPYRASIPVTWATAEDFPEVVFGAQDMEDFEFCPNSVSGAGCVYIYCASIPDRSVVLPAVVVWKIAK